HSPRSLPKEGTKGPRASRSDRAPKSNRKKKEAINAAISIFKNEVKDESGFSTSTLRCIEPDDRILELLWRIQRNSGSAARQSLREAFSRDCCSRRNATLCHRSPGEVERAGRRSRR